jgi:hypothetical protein
VQAGSPNHRKLRRLRAGVVSVAEKARCQRVRWATRRRTCVNHCRRIDRRNDGIKTGGSPNPRDKGTRMRALSQGVACVLPWRCPV